ncbi:MAG: DUF4065 domain-containing protein [Christensenellaceae bacterium]|nr:DUF4065 domain-containing protein [Christensenellaceae bacterium]
MLWCNEERLFHEDIFHWAFGPVVVEIYNLFKKFSDRSIDEQAPADIDVETEVILTGVYDEFGKYSACGLSEMTHLHDPWKKTQINQVMPYEDIVKYFAREIVEE